MINFYSFGSSSAGNLYIVSDGRTHFILECGFPLSKMREKIGNLSQYSACFVSHAHGDHAKAVHAVLNAALPIYASKGTLETCGVDGHYRAIAMQFDRWYSIKTFQVYMFETHHDVNGSAGFIFVSGDESLLFATDTYMIPIKFKGLTHLAIECNYIDELLNDNIENGSLPVAMKNRIIQSHMSMKNCINYIEKIDKSNLKEIHLLHLSDGNSNEDIMKREVQKVSGCLVNVCGK